MGASRGAKTRRSASRPDRGHPLRSGHGSSKGPITSVPRIVFEPEALDELDEAAQFLEEQRPGHGDRLTAAFDRAVVRIRDLPHSGSRVDESLRRCRVKGFPYWIVYGYSPERLEVVAVAHTSREPEYWRERVSR